MNPLRRKLGTFLRDNVGGPEADAAEKQIWGANGRRWHDPDGVLWHVNGDAAMYIGGIRALLMQALHPAAMAGVAGHSGYKSDPWGRLQRTANFIAMTTYGPIDEGEKLIEKIRGIHERVRGKTEDGEPYRASDPHLLAWVHIAETESFLTCFKYFGDRKLTQAEADEYVASAALVGEKLGAIDLPRTEAEMTALFEAYRPELKVTEAAKQVIEFILKSPPKELGNPGYYMLAHAAVATLPPWALEAYGLDANRWRGAKLAMGRIGAAAIRWALTDPVLAGSSRKLAATNAARSEIAR